MIKERGYLRRVLFHISGDMEGEEQVKAIWHCVFSPRGEAMEEGEGCHGMKGVKMGESDCSDVCTPPPQVT